MFKVGQYVRVNPILKKEKQYEDEIGLIVEINSEYESCPYRIKFPNGDRRIMADIELSQLEDNTIVPYIEMDEIIDEIKIRGFEIVSDEFRKFPNEEIVEPQRGTSFSAGYDIRTPMKLIIEPHSYSDLVFTDVKAYMQLDEVLILHVRSSIGMKKGLTLANCTGVIDSDYYNNEDTGGNIGFKLYNSTNEVITIEKGERVLQGIFMNYLTADSDKPMNTERQGGIGSTNK